MVEPLPERGVTEEDRGVIRRQRSRLETLLSPAADKAAGIEAGKGVETVGPDDAGVDVG